MASNVSHTLTLVERAESESRHPTLRLSSKKDKGKKENKEKEKEKEYKAQCEKAKEEIVNKIAKALNENVEGMRSFLLSLVPEDPAELKKFMECLPQLQALVEQQTKFNSELVESVGNYLVKTWEMIANGATPEEMEEFKKNQRKKACDEHEERSAKLQKQMESLVPEREESKKKDNLPRNK